MVLEVRAFRLDQTARRVVDLIDQIDIGALADTMNYPIILVAMAHNRQTIRTFEGQG